MTARVTLPLARLRPEQQEPKAAAEWDGGSASRAAFVARVADAFDRAGVEYVVLHGSEPAEIDSDVDIAVDRSSVAVVDALVRLGTFGRLLQSLHYDVPWCCWYVLETGDPRRPYRQLDVACDPWGVGRYGPAIPLALRRAHRSPQTWVRVPDPAAEAVYLAVKRARKGLARAQDSEQLSKAFAACPTTARELLGHSFGAAGAAVANALEANDADELERGLTRLRRRLTLQAAAPRSITRRARQTSARIAGRLARPSGLVVSVAGPDGVGKSTLASALEGTSDGVFRRFAHFHLGPSVLVRPGRLLRRPPASGDDPHHRAPSGVLGSVTRLAYLWLDMAIAWLPRVALPRFRSTLVVIERGWLDLSVDPRRYRIDLPPWTVRLAGAFLPRPDLTLVLAAAPAAIRERKAELSRFEIKRQLSAWQALAAADPERFVTIDATNAAGMLAAAAGAISDRLASRQRDLARHAFALDCVGRPSVTGEPYEVLDTGSRARWVLPARPGAPGPLRTGLYRPARARHRTGAFVLEHARRLGARRYHLKLDVAQGIGPSIADALRVRRVELAVAMTGAPSRGDRLLIAALEGDTAIAYVKVARTEEAAPLHHERRILESLASCSLRALRVPDVVTLLEWDRYSALLLRPVDTRGRADRPLGAVETSALGELARLGASLAPVLGYENGLIPIHGDFAPWNCSRTGARLTLWDWEACGLGLPFEDLFHWRIQRLALFAEGTVGGLVDGAFAPDSWLLALANELGTRDRDLRTHAPAALRSALQRGLRVPQTAEEARAAAVRREALELLTRRCA